MSKAEERAQAVYPSWRNGLDEEFNSSSAYCGFIKGYHQAEQDLELTWEDVKTIDKLLNQCIDYSNPYQEVLKRFKERKK